MHEIRHAKTVSTDVWKQSSGVINHAVMDTWGHADRSKWDECWEVPIKEVREREEWWKYTRNNGKVDKESF